MSLSPSNYITHKAADAFSHQRPFSSMKFREQMSTVLQTVQESFSFVGIAQAAAEIEYRIIVLQGQGV